MSILRIIAFFHAGDHPVGGLFIGLTGVYVGGFLANPVGDAPKSARQASACWASSTSAPDRG
jgi:hypothetical protein